MNWSPTVNELAAALAKAQKAFGVAEKNRVNPAFGKDRVFKYADLAAVIEAYRAPCADNGLAILQLTKDGQDNWVTVETVIVHTSGQWVSSELSLPAPQGTPQDFGKALTYCRRYGISTMLNIAADEDDDGNSATAAVVQRSVPRPSSGSPQGEVAHRPAPPPTPPPGTPGEGFESLKSALAATASGPGGHQARLFLSKRVIEAQKAGKVNAEQVEILRVEYERLEKGG